MREVLRRADGDADGVEVFAHGMTVGTNALLEERGARTALVANAGFGDLLEIARQDRPELYRLCTPKPAPLVEAEMRFEAAGRIGPEGELEPLADAEVDRVAAAVAAADPESVAVCLLFSYLDASHEERLAERLRELLPGAHVSTSSGVLPRFREFERCSTTVIDAYLSPLLDRYLTALGDAASGEGLPQPLVMQSSGGVAPAEEAATAGAWSVLSGPAGGAVGAGLLARISGDGNALGFDMGGTSCDVCVVDEGQVRRTDARLIAGRVIQLPMVDVHTVGAGGGSIGWADPGGALRVGPRSAGAEPGPACYGLGGEQPTVTDANLTLGYLAPDSRLAGGVALEIDAAQEALARLGATLGLSAMEIAEGIVRVANQGMVQALRVVTVERGVDPRGYALMPFGGSRTDARGGDRRGAGDRPGPLPPRRRGALGPRPLCLGAKAGHGEDRDAQRSRAQRREGRGADGRADLRPARRPRRRVAATGRLRASLPRPGLRALGAGAAAARPRGAAGALRGRARATLRLPRPRGRGRAGRHSPGDGRARPRAEAVAAPSEAGLARSSRRARFGASGSGTGASRRASAGTAAVGPAIFELPEATLVPPGWLAEVDPPGRWSPGADEPRPGDAAGARRLAARGLRRDGRGADPGLVLREHQGAPRLLDGALRRGRRACDAGRAHTGASRIDARRGRGSARPRAAPGVSWILNDPFRGGTHLPDITLIGPVFAGYGLIGFAPAARIMPTSAARLRGGCRRARRALRGGSGDRPDQADEEALMGSRNGCATRASGSPTCSARGPPTRSANSSRGAGRAPRGGRLAEGMGAILAYAERRTRAALAELPEMNNFTLAGEGFTYYETIGGGQGACPDADGPSAIHVAMSNTLNTPIEGASLEADIPVRVRELSVRRGTGGAGRRRGGDGIVREIEALAPMTFTLIAERRRHARGVRRGSAAAGARHAVGRAAVVESRGGAPPGDRLRIETPGGGGYGAP